MKLGWMIGAGLALGAAPASAAELIGTYSGNECGGRGGFSNCYAFPDGTTGQGQNEDETGSPSIFKYNSDGSTDTSSMFDSIDGSEFTFDYNASSNVLNFTYTPGMEDPSIFYYAIFQAGTTNLFYSASPITSGSIDLSEYYPNNPGYSHITFFDTGGGMAGGIPEPATWAFMILGFGLIGGVMRRKTSRTTSLEVSYS